MQAGSAGERRPTLRRPYMAPVSAIILQALKDLHNPDLEAQVWLDSPMSHLMLETRGMDPEELPAAVGRARERKPLLLGGAQGPRQGSEAQRSPAHNPE